ncbi:MAG: YigZ family protein [Lachnospiraceae bacterium]|nr:YigZ family protein [Lachnospiraceae bacterium]
MSYRTVYTGGQGEIEEKKSRFIATVQPVSSEKEALDFLAATRKKYWDARHNCYAYTIGTHSELQRCSDDGEPGGTAGRPILNILLNEDIHNCIVVVTRYFGGTLLGTGGLIRAYQAATQEGLAHCVIVERKSGCRLTIHTDYNYVGKLQFLIAEEKAVVLDSRYTDTVELDVILPLADAAGFSEKVTEITGARAKIRVGDPMEYAEADGEVILFREDC